MHLERGRTRKGLLAKLAGRIPEQASAAPPSAEIQEFLNLEKKLPGTAIEARAALSKLHDVLPRMASRPYRERLQALVPKLEEIVQTEERTPKETSASSLAAALRERTENQKSGITLAEGTRVRRRDGIQTLKKPVVKSDIPSPSLQKILGTKSTPEQVPTPLPLESSPFLDTTYDIIAAIEASPNEVDTYIEHIKQKMREAKVDPQFRTEAKELVRTFGEFVADIQGTKDKAGMTNTEVSRHASEMLDALERVGEGRPLAALPDTNPFKRLAVVERMPHVMGTAEMIAEDLAKRDRTARNIRGITQFRGPISQVSYYTGAAAFSALAYGSFAFAGTGVRNFVINAGPHMVPFLDIMHDKITDTGYNPDVIGDWTSRLIGVGGSLWATRQMLKYRPRHDLDNRERIKFWLGTFILMGGAFAGLTEKVVNASETGHMGHQTGIAGADIEGKVSSIPAALASTKTNLIASAHDIVLKEASGESMKSAGPKTMIYILTYQGEPTAEQQAAFDSFIGKHGGAEGKYTRSVRKI